ncbi:MAG: chaperone modulator CbpM [Saprospiraceae bacterium]|nr:chaperone modulator CbpM [Saprospiraceae bacterium]MDZ4705009.1 chaperone modulator CbpM [Saprospiraceae bacterium]
MNTENLIPLSQLCLHYQVELSFFSSLNEIGLIEIEIIEQSQYLHQDKINDVEKMIRLYHELNVNPEGIDVVFNLLQKVEALQLELISVTNRLQVYKMR